MNFKKIITLGIATCLTFSLVACSSDSSKETPKQSEQANKTETVSNAFKDAELKLLESLKPLPEASKSYKIAAIEPTLSNPFWVTVKDGYEAAAKEYGVSIDVLSGKSEEDTNGQLDIMKTAIGKDYNAITMSTITPFNLIPGVAEANKKNLPVIAVGNSIDDAKGKEVNAKINAFITSDFKEQGKIGGKFIVDKITSGKVAIIEGMAGAAQGEARKNGAKSAFDEAKGIEIVSTQAGNWDRKKAYDITTNIIQANPDLKGIFCANDVMALGAVDALKAAEKKDQVTVVGVDFIDDAKKSIESGELDATVAMSPYLFGKGGLILALKVLENQELKDGIYWTPLEIVHKENVNTFGDWK